MMNDYVVLTTCRVRGKKDYAQIVRVLSDYHLLREHKRIFEKKGDGLADLLVISIIKGEDDEMMEKTRMIKKELLPYAAVPEHAQYGLQIRYVLLESAKERQAVMRTPANQIRTILERMVKKDEN